MYCVSPGSSQSESMVILVVDDAYFNDHEKYFAAAERIILLFKDLFFKVILSTKKLCSYFVTN